GINWTTVLLIGAIIPLSTAMQATGAAERIATALVDVLGDSSPYLLLRGGVPDPVATPANVMVMEPGGYRFGDYWKLGLPLLVLFLVVAVFLVPVLWRF
ncbi:MAG TPA: SLC13 family permease, partial [Actinomycetota bacterium]|nr:SLC13 family permease [Actinomycetota bacterium]